jgi:hypothetical protein
MRAPACAQLTVILGLTVAVPLRAETYTLAETPAEGDHFRVAIETKLAGVLKVTRENKSVPVKIAATNEHAFVERVLATDRDVTRRALRYYSNAVSRATVDGESVVRTLPTERRLIVAQRTGDALLCYSPAGPLTRSELEVVSEHFETLHLAGLLPGRAVAVGDTWKLSATVAQSLCLFEGLIAHELSGKLEAVNGEVATIRLAGTAKGIENGALANLTIEATIQFDLTRKRIAAVEWKQKDVRDQGPVTPGAEVETTTRLRREPLDATPVEFGAQTLARVPEGDEPPAGMRQLVHRDPKGRYQLLHDRDWHVVGQTDHHLVMRLLDRGDFVTQLTLAWWAGAAAGKHITPEEFEKLVASTRGWKADEITDRGEVPTDADRWAYRIVARGELDGAKAVQSFYAVAGAKGEQVIATFTMKPANAARLGTRDVAIVNAIDFPKK